MIPKTSDFILNRKERTTWSKFVNETHEIRVAHVTQLTFSVQEIIDNEVHGTVYTETLQTALNLARQLFKDIKENL